MSIHAPIKPKAKRPRLTPEQRQAMYNESLSRARACKFSNANGEPAPNFLQVLTECAARGYSEPIPGENVLTFNAWKALGRRVKKGEKGIQIHVIVEREATEAEQMPHSDLGMLAAFNGIKQTTVKKTVTSYVFHICQTEPVEIKLDFDTPKAETAEA